MTEFYTISATFVKKDKETNTEVTTRRFIADKSNYAWTLLPHPSFMWKTKREAYNWILLHGAEYYALKTKKIRITKVDVGVSDTGPLVMHDEGQSKLIDASNALGVNTYDEIRNLYKKLVEDNKINDFPHLFQFKNPRMLRKDGLIDEELDIFDKNFFIKPSKVMNVCGFHCKRTDIRYRQTSLALRDPSHAMMVKMKLHEYIKSYVNMTEINEVLENVVD